MELFNKLNNKDFYILSNYINKCINYPESAKTKDKLKALFAGESGSETTEEFLRFILNLNTEPYTKSNFNANLLVEDNNGKMIPVIGNYVSIRPTIAQKAWLYAILEDNKWPFFITKELHDKLCDRLGNSPISPLDSKALEMHKYSNQQVYAPSPEHIETFKIILDAIKGHRYLSLTNTTFKGLVYKDQIVYPYKLEYDIRFGSFSLICMSKENKTSIKMNLKNLSDVKKLEIAKDYEALNKEIEEQQTAKRVAEPMQIEISNPKNGYDRCSLLFSNYDKECYYKDENEETLIMNIYYYDYNQQREELLRNLLFLGDVVKLISPQDLLDEYKEILKRSYANYEP